MDVKKGDTMDKDIKKSYGFDCVILAGFSVLLVFIIAYVLYSLGQFSDEWPVRMGIMASGMLTVSFALTAVATVIIHLYKNSEKLYSSKMECQEVCLKLEAIEGEGV